MRLAKLTETVRHKSEWGIEPVLLVSHAQSLYLEYRIRVSNIGYGIIVCMPCVSETVRASTC